MKILHVVPYMHPAGGGPPVVVDRFCRELIRLGHDAEVVTTDALSEGDRSWEDQYRDHYPLHVIDTPSRGASGFRLTMAQRLRPRFADRPDIVHLHNLWAYPNLVAGRLCRNYGIPFVVSSHGMLDPHSLSRKSLKKAAYGTMIEFPHLRRANGMVYTHPEEQRLATESVSGLPKGHIVPLGADEPPIDELPAARSQLLAEFPEFEQKKLVLFLGRVHPKKGLDLLLPGFSEAMRTSPDLHLVLCGPVAAEYRDTLERRIESLGLQEAITLTGPRFGLQKWAMLSQASMFVLPSYQENFAITVVEALRMQVPVILSRRVNIYSDLEQADAAIVCELTSASVAESILRLAAAPGLAATLASNGLDLVRSRFNWAAATPQLLDCYTDVIASRQPSN